MPVPVPPARGLAATAAGVFAVLAATATMTPVNAGSMQHQDMSHNHSGKAREHAATFGFGAPGRAAHVDRIIRVKAGDISFDPTAVEVLANGIDGSVHVTIRENDKSFQEAATSAPHGVATASGVLPK